ncbi:MAG TPA: SPOR domain-containing protein [Firmicutes bacterium]|nr:SPOR domain-containing protein [Bacillota bacterium]
MAEHRGRAGEGVSLIASLVVIGLIAIALGYLMGNYAIRMLSGNKKEPGVTQISSGNVRPPSQAQSSGDSASSVNSNLGNSSASQPSSLDLSSSIGTSAAGGARAPGGTSLPATTGSSGESPVFYRVRVGSFDNKAEADALAAKLGAEGYPTYVNTSPPYTVQVGAFQQKENADKLVEELRGKGYSPSIAE